MKRGITNDLIERVVRAYPKPLEIARTGNFYRYWPFNGTVTVTTKAEDVYGVDVKIAAVRVPRWARKSGWLILSPPIKWSAEISELTPWFKNGDENE